MTTKLRTHLRNLNKHRTELSAILEKCRPLLTINGAEGIQTAIDELAEEHIRLLNPKTVGDIRLLGPDLHVYGLWHLINQYEDLKNKGRTYEEAEEDDGGWCGDSYTLDLDNSETTKLVIQNRGVQTIEDLINFLDLLSAEPTVLA